MLLGFGDATIDSGRHPEIIGIDDQPAHRFSVAQSTRAACGPPASAFDPAGNRPVHSNS